MILGSGGCGLLQNRELESQVHVSLVCKAESRRKWEDCWSLHKTLTGIVCSSEISSHLLWLTEPCDRQGNSAFDRTCHGRSAPLPMWRTHVVGSPPSCVCLMLVTGWFKGTIVAVRTSTSPFAIEPPDGWNTGTVMPDTHYPHQPDTQSVKWKAAVGTWMWQTPGTEGITTFPERASALAVPHPAGSALFPHEHSP